MVELCFSFKINKYVSFLGDIKDLPKGIWIVSGLDAALWAYCKELAIPRPEPKPALSLRPSAIDHAHPVASSLLLEHTPTVEQVLFLADHDHRSAWPHRDVMPTFRGPQGKQALHSVEPLHGPQQIRVSAYDETHAARPVGPHLGCHKTVSTLYVDLLLLCFLRLNLHAQISRLLLLLSTFVLVFFALLLMLLLHNALFFLASLLTSPCHVYKIVQTHLKPPVPPAGPKLLFYKP